MMKNDTAATQLEALGNVTRLEIYRELVGAGDEGSPVGEIRDRLDIPASTLSHHISKLVHSGLITQQRESRSLICRANAENMDALVMFLAHNCCADDSSIWS